MASKVNQVFHEKLTSFLLTQFQNTQEAGGLPSSFYEANIILIPNPEEDTREKKKIQLEANIPDEHRQ